MKQRCQWCQGHDIYVTYHDEEWGVPLHDDRKLFESLVLDGAQAGLSWLNLRYAGSPISEHPKPTGIDMIPR